MVYIQTGDVCSVWSQDKTQSEVATTTGNSAQLMCASRIYISDRYTIYWTKYTQPSENVLRHYSYSNSVYYYNGYSESEYTVNITDSSLTVHNVTLMDGGCYRCRQLRSNKYVYDAVSLTTASSKCS